MLNKPVVLLITLSILLGTIFIQYKWIGALKIENALLLAEIGTLKAQSKAAEGRVEQAHKDAIINMKQSQINAKQIMLADVSPKCRLAIKWAIQQAQGFNA